MHFVNYVPTAPRDKSGRASEQALFSLSFISPPDSINTVHLKRPLTDAEFGETGFLNFKNSEEDCSTHLYVNPSPLEHSSSAV